MNWLFEQLRPQYDETALHDDENFTEEITRTPPPLRHTLVFAAVMLGLGLFFLVGIVLIGIHVEWDLLAVLPSSRLRVWAWVGMLFLAALGGFLTWFGASVAWHAVRTRRSRED